MKRRCLIVLPLLLCCMLSVQAANSGEIALGGDEAAAVQTETRAVRLPRVGQLWWPVPILSSIGMIVFAKGWFYGKNS